MKAKRKRIPRTFTGIMAQVAAGRSNAVIAGHYGVAECTIGKDLTKIYKWLGCNASDSYLRRCQAITICFRRGLIS